MEAASYLSVWVWGSRACLLWLWKINLQYKFLWDCKICGISKHFPEFVVSFWCLMSYWIQHDVQVALFKGKQRTLFVKYLVSYVSAPHWMYLLSTKNRKLRLQFTQSQQKIRKMLPGRISSQILLHFDGINNTSAWIHPTLYQRCWCWSKGYGDIFLVLFGPHSSNWASFKPHSLLYLSIFADLYEHSYNHQIISN